MKIKSLLSYSYRAIEILIILSVAIGILAIGINCHDNAEMGELLNSCIVAIVWLWFISLPLLIIYIASFIRSIPPVSIYKKIVLSLHILNVALWGIFYIFLPKPNPCDAALMEEHYRNHHADMYDLVKYARNSLDDSCSIVLNYRNDEVVEFKIENNRDCKECVEIEDEHKLDTILHSVGLSMQKLKEIQSKMHKAGVIGIEINKNPKFELEENSILLFRWYGVTRYQYALYYHPMTENERDNVLRLHQFILYNDSVVFESYGGFPGGRGFPDKDEFENRMGRPNQE
jgi:hypothetical protein